ncbi:hypothetical protein PBRA_006161 [Plasmodiophora brassicae]|uniref:Uncharacterized protein n=1 Tax=Plasmodiophora brassicae TaxID=37360 RepID=A0A0G4IRP6_PLABS|nr:hypothetical protein PBRA_006161 [Plasmodiophora brassicae]
MLRFRSIRAHSRSAGPDHTRPVPWWPGTLSSRHRPVSDIDGVAHLEQGTVGPALHLQKFHLPR